MRSSSHDPRIVANLLLLGGFACLRLRSANRMAGPSLVVINRRFPVRRSFNRNPESSFGGSMSALADLSKPILSSFGKISPSITDDLPRPTESTQ